MGKRKNKRVCHRKMRVKVSPSLAYFRPVRSGGQDLQFGGDEDMLNRDKIGIGQKVRWLISY